MGKKLVLAEKPSVGKDIAKVLKCTKFDNGYIEGKDYIITWALGHLVTLAQPESYNPKYKSWNIEDLPMLPNKMDLTVIKETSKQYGTVTHLMRRNDVDGLIIATDSGREGELVARWIIEKANFRKPIKRLWISSQTDKAILTGFNNLKPSKDYDNLYKSAKSRAEADWLVGLNVTRALTCKHNTSLSAGRVQTPTLSMIVERESEIKKFKPVDFWTLDILVEGFYLKWYDSKTGNSRIFNKTELDSLNKKISNKDAIVSSLTKEAKRENSPNLYDLTELQRDANKKFGLSAKETLSIMQKLYEHHKVLTYPRTDSRYLTDDIVPTIKDRLKCISIGQYKSLSEGIIKNGFKVSKSFVDNSKVTDHHAIIPTDGFVDLSSLSIKEKQIYDLVVRRFLAVLSAPYLYHEIMLTAKIDGETFKAKESVTESLGWKSCYDKGSIIDDNQDEKKQKLPQLKVGQSLKVKNTKIGADKTKPPARYNEATLLSAMEHPGKFTDNKELKEILDSSKGLGTPATRADIIEKLFDSFYVERRGKDIYPTSKGMQLYNLVPNELKSPELTAKWEQQLYIISQGKQDPKVFIDEMRRYATLIVSNVISSTAEYKHDNITMEKCPECGENLLNINGKKGKMLACKNRECGYKKSISKTSNARCPECHKKMEIKGTEEKAVFYCVCGHREKLSDFKNRKKNQVSSRDVKDYLNKQSNTGSLNSSLFDKLKNL